MHACDLSKDGHVLVAHPDSDRAGIYEAYLADEYATRVATDRATAVDRWADAAVAVVDQAMATRPESGGVRDRIVRDGGPPVVVLASGPPDDQVQSLPVDEFLSKPVARGPLVSTVRELVTRAALESKARTFAELAARDGDVSPATDTSDGEDRLRRLSRLRAEIDDAMDGMLTDAMSRAAPAEPSDAEIHALLDDIVDHRLPPDVARLVADYQTLPEARPVFMWKWVHRLAPQNTLPVVAEQHRSRVPVDKTLAILFVTILDDRLETRGDRSTFGELAKIPVREQRADPARPGVDAEAVRIARRVWRTLVARLEQAPRFDRYVELFRFDLAQAIGAIRYSDITIRNPALATMADLERIESHNMVMFAYADIDLMYASEEADEHLADIRHVVWIAQQMARIGNWVSTWERELREGDWSSGPIVYALEEGVFTQAELRRSREDEALQADLIERIREQGIEQEFLGRWQRQYHTLQTYDDTLGAVDLEPFIEGTRKVLRYHLASRGLK